MLISFNQTLVKLYVHYADHCIMIVLNCVFVVLNELRLC